MYLILNSEHYCFHYQPNSQAAMDIDEIVSCQEECFSRICKTLNVQFPHTIHYWLCDTPEEVGHIYGDNEPCNGFARKPDTVYAVYNKDVTCIGAHEDAHLISYIIATPNSCFLREGLAMFFDQTWWGRPNQFWVKKMISDKNTLIIETLFDDEVFYKHDCSLTYPLAGAFTQYLIEQFGLESYLTMYQCNSGDWSQSFIDCFSKNLQDIEADFWKQLKG